MMRDGIGCGRKPNTTIAAMSARETPVLPAEAVAKEFRSDVKSYEKAPPIVGVQVQRLQRFVDDRGFFQEVYRSRADHPGSEGLAGFFADVPVAQMNYSVVN